MQAAAAALTEFSDIGFGFGCCQRNCHEKDDDSKEKEGDDDNGDGDANEFSIIFHDFDLNESL